MYTAAAPRTASMRAVCWRSLRRAMPLHPTRKRLEVLRLVASGKRDPRGGGGAASSVNTVEYHLRNLFIKLGASSRADALMRRQRSGCSTAATRYAKMAPLRAGWALGRVEGADVADGGMSGAACTRRWARGECMADWQVELKSLLLSCTSASTARWTRRRRSRAWLAATAAASAATDEADSDIPWTLGPLTAEELPADGEEVSAVRDKMATRCARSSIWRTRAAWRARCAMMSPSSCRRSRGPARQAAHAARTGRARPRRNRNGSSPPPRPSCRFCRLVLRLTNALSSEAEC